LSQSGTSLKEKEKFVLQCAFLQLTPNDRVQGYHGCISGILNMGTLISHILSKTRKYEKGLKAEKYIRHCTS
jgi:hypothetical protein